MRLLRVEFRRLESRRLVRWSVVAVFAGLLVAPVLVPWAFEQQARIRHDADIERCVQDKSPKVRDGVTMPTIPRDLAVPAERDRLCREVLPTLDSEFHLRQLDQVLRTTAALLVIGGFLIGASAIGADWQAHVIPTVLMWESRRVRVFLARLGALVGAVFVGVALWQLVLAFAVLPSTLLDDTTDGAGWTWLRGISGLGLRITVVATVAAAFGYALALIGRGTAAALGIGFAYLLVFENVAGSQFKPLRPWLALWNSVVFVKGTFEAGGDVPGRSVGAAAAILAGFTLAVLVVAALVFRRRDAA